MKRTLLKLALLTTPLAAHAETPRPFISGYVGEGSTKVQVSKKRVDKLGLDAYGLQAGVKWKYARASVDYDYLPNKLSNGQMLSATVAAQYKIGKFTPFIGGGAGYSHNKKQGRMPVYIATTGVEYAIDERWSIEARYRFVHPIQESAKPAHIVGIGFTFRF
jgi:opacity protein-like surface antigen